MTQNKIAVLNFKPLAASSGAAPKEHQIDLALPFKGHWFVMQGGDTLNVNHHMSVRAQWYAVDFMKVGGPSQRELAKTDGSTIEDFYSWGEPVLSPRAGEVVEVVNNLTDNPLGKKDAQNPAGNHVVIKAAPDRCFHCPFATEDHQSEGRRSFDCGAGNRQVRQLRQFRCASCSPAHSGRAGIE
jgi:hypothetical protein